MKKLLFAPVFAILMIACSQKNDYPVVIHNPDLFSDAVFQLNNVVLFNNFSPPVASRNYAYAAIAAYECIAIGDPEHYQSLSGQLNGFNMKPIQKKEPLDYQLSAILAYLNIGKSVTFSPDVIKDYTDSIVKLARDHGMSKQTIENSIDLTNQVSAEILEWSKHDRYKETRSAPRYSVLDSPGRWIPTPPMYADAVEPSWAQIRTMVLEKPDQFPAPPPPAYNMKDTTSKYYKEVIAIKTARENLTEDQKHMAEFWDDNPFKLNVSGHLMFGTKKFSPPGHWMNIVAIAAKKSKSDFNETVYAYAKTSIALFDSFISCWSEKFTYNTMRPETVINKFMDQNWQPYLQTPPFPEYTCGHSTTSSAAAETLTDVFGDNFSYTDSSEMMFGIKPRSFTSFRQAAFENNWARFYGGIHFHNSCIVSTECGRLVGDFINTKLKMKKA